MKQRETLKCYQVIPPSLQIKGRFNFLTSHNASFSSCLIGRDVGSEFRLLLFNIGLLVGNVYGEFTWLSMAPCCFCRTNCGNTFRCGI